MSMLLPKMRTPRRGGPGTSWAARVPPMRPMAEVGDREWVWDQPRRFAEHFELRASGELIATLNHEAGLSPMRPFHAETAEGAWTLKRRHFLVPSYDVRRRGEPIALAQFQPGWLGRGRLGVHGGPEYGWKLESLWRFEWAWIDAAGSPVISFRPKFAFARARARVEVTGTGLRLAELPVLALLGWILMLHSRKPGNS